jgi:stage V sporulation protein B
MTGPSCCFYGFNCNNEIMSSQTVSQGTLYLTIANLTFLFSGYIINIGLGRILGPESYGTYAIIISIATMFNLIFTTGIPQAVSKYTSEDICHEKNVLKTGLIVSVCLSIVFYLFMIFGSTEIASLLHDTSLTPFIQIVSLMIVTYGPLYAIIAYFNGIQDYRTQSFLNILYNSLKPVLIFTFVFLGFSLWGAVVGFVLSPLIPLIVGIMLIGFHTLLSAKNFSFNKIIIFSVPIIILSVSTNLILTLDLFFIKGILLDNQLTGLYSAASQIARIPYFIMMGICAALFPAISACMQHQEKIKKYIRESVRYTLILIIPVTAMIAATAIPLISLAFSENYIAGGEPLEILIFGICLFGIFSLFITIISGCDNPYPAMGFCLIVLIIDFFANLVLVPRMGMNGGAWGTTIASLIGLGICSVYLQRKFGMFVEGLSVLKIIIASSIVYMILSLIDIQGIFLIIAYAISFSGYLLLLYLMKEITAVDISLIKKLILPNR